MEVNRLRNEAPNPVFWERRSVRAADGAGLENQ